MDELLGYCRLREVYRNNCIQGGSKISLCSFESVKSLLPWLHVDGKDKLIQRAFSCFENLRQTPIIKSSMNTMNILVMLRVILLLR